MQLLAPDVITGLSLCGMSAAFFFPSGRNSLRGPCPTCGGKRRLVVYLNGAFPRWYMRCDLCGFDGWAPNLFPAVKWPAEDEGRTAPQAGPARDTSAAVAALRRLKVDEVTHANLTEADRGWWRAQGVADSMQDFYKLGVVKGRPFKRFKSEGLMVLDAYTIPKYGRGWELNNVDFRMLNAPPEEGRYRPFPGAPSTAFLARPDAWSLANEDGTAFLVEGSKKAMVLSQFLDGAQVVGVPSANAWAGVLDQLEDASLVYVLLDADAWAWGRKACKQLGAKARQVTLPVKVDDAIIRGTLSPDDFEAALTMGRREAF